MQRTPEQMIQTIAAWYKACWTNGMLDQPLFTWPNGKPENPPTYNEIAEPFFKSEYPGFITMKLAGLDECARIWFDACSLKKTGKLIDWETYDGDLTEFGD